MSASQTILFRLRLRRLISFVATASSHPERSLEDDIPPSRPLKVAPERRRGASRRQSSC